MEQNIKTATQKTAKCWICTKRQLVKDMDKCIDCCAYLCFDCIGDNHSFKFHQNYT